MAFDTLQWILNSVVKTANPFFPMIEKYEDNHYIYYALIGFTFLFFMSMVAGIVYVAYLIAR